MSRVRVAATIIAAYCSVTIAQIGEQVATAEACSMFGEPAPATVILFASDQEAENVIQRILDSSGLTKNFEVRAAGVQNASAVIQGTRRLILYNQFFMQQTRDQTGSQWAPISIMAHEVGHHLNGHTLLPGGSRPQIELEADYFSGFVLQKMGAPLIDARIAMDRFGSPTGSGTHPAKHDRLAAITSGWKKACDADPACKTANASKPVPISKPAADTTDSCKYAKDGECDEPNLCRPGTDTTDCRVPGKREQTTSGPDSCKYAGDGECDEPDLCPRGTDTTDCRVSRRAQSGRPITTTPSGGSMATMCMTQAGPCSLPPGPRGVICTCFTPFGPIQGTSR